MSEQNQNAEAERRPFVDVPRWYYVSIFALALLSMITLGKTPAGEWEISIGIDEITALLMALAILPLLLRFLIDVTGKGAFKIPGVVELSWDRKLEIDRVIDDKQATHMKAGEAAKAQTRKSGEIEEMQRNADQELEKAITPQELPILQQIYFQELNELVKAFNRNRHLRTFDEGTAAEGDEIAYKMRSMAPLLFGKLSVADWLSSRNPGKRLAAVKYLDWAQDVEYVEDLLDLLTILKKDTFQQFHILLALSSMADQLAFEQKDLVLEALSRYKPDGDRAREFVRDRIVRALT